jgi:pimeloyl-ACP methyl ester carboxylesterase
MTGPADDRAVGPDACRSLAGRLPSARVVECPGEGHFFVIPHAEEMLRQAAGLN